MINNRWIRIIFKKPWNSIQNKYNDIEYIPKNAIVQANNTYYNNIYGRENPKILLLNVSHSMIRRRGCFPR